MAIFRAVQVYQERNLYTSWQLFNCDPKILASFSNPAFISLPFLAFGFNLDMLHETKELIFNKLSFLRTADGKRFHVPWARRQVPLGLARRPGLGLALKGLCPGQTRRPPPPGAGSPAGRADASSEETRLKWQN